MGVLLYSSLASFVVALFSTGAMDALSESPQLFDEPTNEPDDPVPSAPPPLYPVLAGDTPDGPASPSQVDTDHTPTASPMVYRSQSDFNMQRVRECSRR